MKIAVVGAGLAGLAFALHFQKIDPASQLVIFDPHKPSKRTSSLANLLYPFTGMRAKQNRDGEKGLLSSLDLINEVSAFSEEPVFQKTSLLKIPKNKKEEAAFIEGAQKHEDLLWLEKTPYHKPGLKIENVYQIDGEKYLEAMQKKAVSLKAIYTPKVFQKEDEKEFDQIVYATGKETSQKLKFSILKGQAMVIKWPLNFVLNHPLMVDGLHLIPSIDKKTLYIGSTFERKFHSFEPEIEVIRKLLIQPFKKWVPTFEEKDILELKAGIRLTAPNRLPKIGSLGSKKWIFTALGSKGLLYHSYLGSLLAEALFEKHTQSIPKEYLITLS